jgi:hypothetical protein
MDSSVFVAEHKFCFDSFGGTYMPFIRPDLVMNRPKPSGNWRLYEPPVEAV